MNLWSSFKKWALRDDPVDPIVPTCHSMVGEPVISFIESLHREKNRRYSFSRITRHQYKGEKAHWMSDSGFFQMVDAKTGRHYQMFLHDNTLYNVVGLPFELNHWEKTALFEAWLKYRSKAKMRSRRITSNRARHEREAAYAQELIDREQFAKQFRENAV